MTSFYTSEMQQEKFESEKTAVFFGESSSAFLRPSFLNFKMGFIISTL